MKLYRKFLDLISLLRSGACKFHLSLKYPGITTSGTTFIERGCEIRCVVGSKIILKHTHISKGCQIIADNGAEIIIEDSFIGPYTVIVAQKGIRIGKNCQIAEMVVIRDQNHNFGASGKTIAEQGFISEGITIGNNVWLASKATVLKGVTIGDNTVIGAHSLVNRNCAADSVYAGIPARKIKEF